MQFFLFLWKQEQARATCDTEEPNSQEEEGHQ